MEYWTETLESSDNVTRSKKLPRMKTRVRTRKYFAILYDIFAFMQTKINHIKGFIFNYHLGVSTMTIFFF